MKNPLQASPGSTCHCKLMLSTSSDFVAVKEEKCCKHYRRGLPPAARPPRATHGAGSSLSTDCRQGGRGQTRRRLGVSDNSETPKRSRNVFTMFQRLRECRTHSNRRRIELNFYNATRFPPGPRKQVFLVTKSAAGEGFRTRTRYFHSDY